MVKINGQILNRITNFWRANFQMQFPLRSNPWNPKISINTFTGFLWMVQAYLQVLWVKLGQILQLKVGCLNFDAVQDLAIYPIILIVCVVNYVQSLTSQILTWLGSSHPMGVNQGFELRYRIEEPQIHKSCQSVSVILSGCTATKQTDWKSESPDMIFNKIMACFMSHIINGLMLILGFYG